MTTVSPKGPPPGAAPPPPRKWLGITLGHAVPRATGDYHWVYLWGAPLRAMHWIAVLSIAVLVVTGFYIGRPYFMTGGEASSHFLMGWMRFLHFTAAAWKRLEAEAKRLSWIPVVASVTAEGTVTFLDPAKKRRRTGVSLAAAATIDNLLTWVDRTAAGVRARPARKTKGAPP